MISLIIICLTLVITCVDSRTYLASNSRDLRQYLRVVSPGDSIQLRDGYYTGHFVANRNGRSNAPIRLIGSQRTVLSNRRGPALTVNGQYWWIRGFTVGNSQRGIAIQRGKNNLLERIIIRDVDEEGITIRDNSDGNTIRSCTILRTGRRNPQNGFGIAIGRSGRQGRSDRSDRNTIVNNRFRTGLAAEAIHVFEGTCCGSIRENIFEGRSLTGANNNQQSNRYWVSLNGNNYRIDRNVGRNTAGDGFRVTMSEGLNSDGQTDDDSSDYNDTSGSDDSGQGCDNQFRGNRCEGISNGFCIRVINENRCQVVVYRDNTVVGAGSNGLTNVAVTNL